MQKQNKWLREKYCKWDKLKESEYEQKKKKKKKKSTLKHFITK